MRLAVLPFSADASTRLEYARQIPNFCADIARSLTGVEYQQVSYLMQVEQDGVMRAQFVNIGDAMLEGDKIAELFEQFQADVIVDGMMRTVDDHFEMTVRVHNSPEAVPIETQINCSQSEVFEGLVTLTKLIGQAAGTELGDDQVNVQMVGTDDPATFLKFLIGYDAMMYIQQSNGAVVAEFSPDEGIDALVEAFKADDGFLAPYEVCCQLCRMCANSRLGTMEKVEGALKELTEIAPDEFLAFMALGELYQMVNQPLKASDLFEKAIKVREERSAALASDGEEDAALAADLPALYVRLGLVQMNLNMPVNAERNFRKAVEIEGDDKPSMDYLAMVLQQTGRAHEVPHLWKEQLSKEPTNAQFNVKYALALLAAGQAEDAEKAFETGLEMVEKNSMVKRYYAQFISGRANHALADGNTPESSDLDRALDFYEDCLDVAPADVELNLEYARTLQMADRGFEVPKVLRDVLGVVQDPDVRAEVLAWLIELEQPKRVEVVQAAGQKMEQGDFDGAARDLKPLRNWLADYWKLWAMLASAQNRLNQYEDAQESAQKLLELFPGCDPGYGELMAALNAQGKHDEAYKLMRFATMRKPQSLGLFINLALAAKRAGHQEEAMDLAKQLREAVGPNPELEPVFAEIEG